MLTERYPQWLKVLGEHGIAPCLKHKNTFKLFYGGGNEACCHSLMNVFCIQKASEMCTLTRLLISRGGPLTSGSGLHLGLDCQIVFGGESVV